jgi:predicted nucleic acid-binding protein
VSSDQSSHVVRTYVDASILLAVIRGPIPYSERALTLLGETNRVFVSSDIVRLETQPKAIFHRQEAEVAFYERFFESVNESINTTPELVTAAFGYATRWNLNGLDALHVAAAIQLDASELLTAERPTSTLARVRTNALRVISIRDTNDT